MQVAAVVLVSDDEDDDVPPDKAITGLALERWSRQQVDVGWRLLLLLLWC